MRQFGYGSSSGLDEKIQQEVNTLMDVYRKKEQSPINPRDHMNRAMANLIFSILINESYQYDSAKLQEKLDIIAKWQGTVAEANILDLFPVLRFIPFKPIKRLREVGKEMKAIYGREVELHKKTYREECLRDVIDVYLKEKGLDFDSQRLIGLFVGFAGKALIVSNETFVVLFCFINQIGFNPC